MSACASYHSHGHRAVITSRESPGLQPELSRRIRLNEPSLDCAAENVLSHAEAGADMVAPSDMMDAGLGHPRGAGRKRLPDNVVIMSYAAKYASAFYGLSAEAPSRRAAVW